MKLKFIVTLLLMFSLSSTFAQPDRFRINTTEYFTISASVNPLATLDLNDITGRVAPSIMGQVEYVGFMYAKVGFESFEALEGGYFDMHAALGINFTSGRWEKFRYYAGVRVARVSRKFVVSRKYAHSKTPFYYIIINTCLNTIINPEPFVLF